MPTMTRQPGGEVSMIHCIGGDSLPRSHCRAPAQMMMMMNKRWCRWVLWILFISVMMATPKKPDQTYDDDGDDCYQWWRWWRLLSMMMTYQRHPQQKQQQQQQKTHEKTSTTTLMALTRLAVLLATSLAAWTKCFLATGLLVFEDATRHALQREEVFLAIEAAADKICW